MKPSIRLCMIVKNEACVIERCLASVRDLVDTWVISDTGSTDGIQRVSFMNRQELLAVVHRAP